MFLGGWGEAPRLNDKRIKVAEKNGDRVGAVTACAQRCRLLIEAMDFAGAKQLLRAARPAAPTPLVRRIELIVAGSAEAGLGNYEGALGYLLRCRDEISQHPMMSDWYSRMHLKRALTEAWLSKGAPGAG